MTLLPLWLTLMDTPESCYPVLEALIVEKRVLAETMISRPVMKAFKSMIREQGLFAGMASEEEVE